MSLLTLLNHSFVTLGRVPQMGRWRIRQVHHMPWTSGSGSSSGNGPWRKVGPVRISGPTNTKTLCELKANKGSLNTKWFQNLSFQSNSNFGKWKTYDYDWPVLHVYLENIRHLTKSRPLKVANCFQWMVSKCSLRWCFCRFERLRPPTEAQRY